MRNELRLKPLALSRTYAEKISVERRPTVAS